MFKYKTVKTGGISYFNEMLGTSSWYWGTDYVDGDLYEAEELYNDHHEVKHNRLILVSYPGGEVKEPVKAEDGQYFGNAVYTEGRVFFLLVDFKERVILIYRCTADCSDAEVFDRIPLDEAKDCYNLMLETEPLTLIRQGHENRFQVVWPDKGDFAIEPQESCDSREGDVLIFGRWFEDPDYREVTVIRRYPSGEVLETIEGTFKRMPDGSGWVLE